jgi:hypothetical protein
MVLVDSIKAQSEAQPWKWKPRLADPHELRGLRQVLVLLMTREVPSARGGDRSLACRWMEGQGRPSASLRPVHIRRRVKMPQRCPSLPSDRSTASLLLSFSALPSVILSRRFICLLLRRSKVERNGETEREKGAGENQGERPNIHRHHVVSKS